MYVVLGHPALGLDVLPLLPPALWFGTSAEHSRRLTAIKPVPSSLGIDWSQQNDFI